MACHVREERHTKRIMSTSISSGGGSSSTRQPQRSGRRARGMLALVAASGGGDDAVTLPYYPYQPPSARLSDRGRRRRRERLLRGHEGSGDDDLEGGGTCSGGDDDWKQQSALYHPEAFEFTLLYFADSTCRNCLRFNPILARFLEAVNGASGGGGGGGTGSADQTLQEGTVAGTALASPTAAATSTHEGQTTTTERGSSSRKVVVQCICVPNDTTEKGADAICRGLGAYCLPFNHENRLALIRLLSVQRVPTVIVLNSTTGQKVTPLGMEGIEKAMSLAMASGSDDDDDDALLIPIADLVDAWRNGGSGLGWVDRCSIS